MEACQNGCITKQHFVKKFEDGDIEVRAKIGFTGNDDLGAQQTDHLSGEYLDRVFVTLTPTHRVREAAAASETAIAAQIESLTAFK